MPDNAQTKLVDIYIKDQVNVLRLAESANRLVEKELAALQKALIALVANDYEQGRPKSNLGTIKEANDLIDDAFDKIKVIVADNQLDVGELEIDTYVDDIQSVLNEIGE